VHDFIIKNVRIVDGTGMPYFHGEVAVKDGIMSEVCRKVCGSARRVLDGQGLVLAPGLIDSHSHSDTPWFVDSRGESKLMQGVTTEVTGQCGMSAAPVTDKRTGGQMNATTEEGSPVTWSTFAEYLDALERNGVGLNIAPLVGHSAIRSSAMGYDNRPPTKAELNEMKSLVVEAMKAGAFGYSSGLIYPPSSYADTAELIELAKAMAPYGGIYVTHMRNEGSELLKSVEEAITIGREAGVPVQISHHKASGNEKVWGKVKDSLKMIDDARKEGVDVLCDQYPYIASATSLTSIIPGWAHEGGPKALLARLKDPEVGKKLKETVDANRRDGGWGRLLITSVRSSKNRFAQGKRIPEIAAIWGIPEVEAAWRLLIEEELEVGEANFGMCEEDVKTVMAHPCVMIGSDSSVTAVDGPLAKGHPHPRTFGTFPRVLGKYVREEKVLSLEQAVYKMTGMAAKRLQLWDRGVIRPGAKADLVLFNPDTIIDTATFDAPCQYPKGIEWVMVNGSMVIENGKHTGRIVGKVLRRPC
jgi:N-acyl-D-amino-acid deacylase